MPPDSLSPRVDGGLVSVGSFGRWAIETADFSILINTNVTHVNFGIIPALSNRIDYSRRIYKGEGAESGCVPAGMSFNGNSQTLPSTHYLDQLLWDKYILDSMPGTFSCLDKLIDREILRVRKLLNMPEDAPPQKNAGPVVSLSKKLFVPVQEYPEFNFVGRILGPRGMTAKQLEQKTGCKIMVRGRGSMRDKAKEEQNRGKQNWEHLNEDLHVLITVEDHRERAEVKLERAIGEIERLLVPSVDGEDELKKSQLMELAILNGTYRNDDGHHKAKAPEVNPFSRQLNVPAGFFFSPYVQAPIKENGDAPSVSPIGVYTYPCYPAEVGGLLYVDPFTPLAGSAYFGNLDDPAKASLE